MFFRLVSLAFLLLSMLEMQIGSGKESQTAHFTVKILSYHSNVLIFV